MIYPLLFLLAAGLNIALGWHYWPAVLAGSLNDPDAYMRLLRIEQGIKAGHLVVRVARDGSGAGTYVEWSRLLDALLWLMAAPLAPFIGWHKALYAAGVALGPLGVGFLGAVLAWAVEPFAFRRYLWTAAVAAALLPGFASAAVPGVVNYHILLLAMIALTAGFVARAWRDDRWAGFLAGVSGGFAIWLTPETMPFILASFAALLLRWMQARNALVILSTAAGCFDVLGLALLLDPPEGGYFRPEVDRVSIVFVVMALAMLVGAMCLLRLERLRRWRALAGFAAMAVPLALWVALFPHVAMGPYGLMPADWRHAFFGVMIELQPLRRLEMVVFLLPGLCAVVYALWRAFAPERVDVAAMAEPALLTGQARQKLLWLYIAAWGVVSLVLGARYLLFAGFPTLLAAGLLPVALSQISAKFAAREALAGAMRIGVLALVLAVPALVAMAASPKLATAGGKTYPSCSLHHIAPLLAPAAGEVVLSQVEDTPELLYRTKVETVGSLYQHGVPGFLRARAAWRAVPGDTVPFAVEAAKAGWVLFCPSPGRFILVQGLPKDTLWDALEDGTPPPWLHKAGQNADGWVLYKVTP